MGLKDLRNKVAKFIGFSGKFRHYNRRFMTANDVAKFTAKCYKRPAHDPESLRRARNLRRKIRRQCQRAVALASAGN
jgi:hypothetical protein